jgi:L-glutamine-phosphate cytidylyltransferase
MINIKQAVILAAGNGSRLRGTLNDRPKGFLKIGNRSIIEESITKLVHSGITDIVIVTGYRFKFYDRLAEKYPFVRTIFNPDFATTGSMLSFCIASKYVNSDFLLLESDLIYEYNALQTLQNSHLKNCILLSGKTGSGDEVYVGIQKEKVVNMSKERNNINFLGGELVGISKISLKLYKRMLNIAKDKCKTIAQYHYEDCLTDLSNNIAINYQCVKNLAWTEIDDENHLKKAREKIYPLIQQRDSKLKISKKVDIPILLKPRLDRVQPCYA